MAASDAVCVSAEQVPLEFWLAWDWRSSGGAYWGASGPPRLRPMCRREKGRPESKHLTEVTPTEQMVHSFMEMIPLVGIWLVSVLREDELRALLGTSSRAPDFSLRLK